MPLTQTEGRVKKKDRTKFKDCLLSSYFKSAERYLKIRFKFNKLASTLLLFCLALQLVLLTDHVDAQPPDQCGQIQRNIDEIKGEIARLQRIPSTTGDNNNACRPITDPCPEDRSLICHTTISKDQKGYDPVLSYPPFQMNSGEIALKMNTLNRICTESQLQCQRVYIHINCGCEETAFLNNPEWRFYWSGSIQCPCEKKVCTQEKVDEYLKKYPNWPSADLEALRAKCPLEGTENGIPGGCGLEFDETKAGLSMESLADCVKCGARVYKCCEQESPLEESLEPDATAQQIESKLEFRANVKDSYKECHGWCFEKADHECGWVCPKGILNLYPEKAVYQREGVKVPKFCCACWGPPIKECQPHTYTCSKASGHVGCECPVQGELRCNAGAALLDPDKGCAEYYEKGIPFINGNVLIKTGSGPGKAICECLCETTLCGTRMGLPSQSLQIQCRSAFLGKSKRDLESGAVQQC